MRPKQWLKQQVKAGRLLTWSNASSGWIDYEPVPDQYVLMYRGKEIENISISPIGELVLPSGNVSRAKTTKQFKLQAI